MKALLLKDWYCAIRTCKSLILIDIVFFIVALFSDGNIFFLVFPCLTAGLIAMALISYEEFDGWDKYADTLPYTRAEIVSSKYILSLLNTIVVGIIASFIQAITMLRADSFNIEGYVFAVLLFLSLGIISTAILYPFIFKFGITKGRIIYYGAIGIGFAICSFLPAIDSFRFHAKMSAAWITVCIILVIATILCISWLASIRFYRAREL